MAVVAMHLGGGSWIRTSELYRGQIYSLLPLTTRPPLRYELEQFFASYLSVSTNTVICSSAYASESCPFNLRQLKFRRFFDPADLKPAFTAGEFPAGTRRIHFSSMDRQVARDAPP